MRTSSAFSWMQDGYGKWGRGKISRSKALGKPFDLSWDARKGDQVGRLPELNLLVLSACLAAPVRIGACARGRELAELERHGEHVVLTFRVVGPLPQLGRGSEWGRGRLRSIPHRRTHSAAPRARS